MKSVEILQDTIIDPKELIITFSEESNRFIDPELEAEAKAEWERILQKAHADGLKPWDGIYYRLENIDEVRNGSRKIKLSTVRYSQIRAFQRLKVSEKYTPEFFTYHISTVGPVITKDGFYVFGFREKTLNANQTTFIGGGLQPDEIKVEKGEDIETNMFKEIKEELGIDKKYIKTSKLIKIINVIERMNAFLIFEIELELTKEEVEMYYDKLEDKEHESLLFIHKDELKKFSGTLPEWMQVSMSHLIEQ